MNKVKAVKALGLLGSICAAVVLALSGSYTEAIGVVSSALASAGVFSPSTPA